MARWVEGIDFQMQEGGKVRCLHCDKTLESKAGLGPHLTACTRKTETPSPSTEGVSEADALPEEHDAMMMLLKDHGIKKGKAIADMMARRSWDDYQILQQYLELSGVRVDRQKLILEAWSLHRGSRLPSGLLEGIRTVQPFNRQDGKGVLTEERLSKILDDREKRKEEKAKFDNVDSRLRRLESGGNPKTSDIQALRTEIKEWKDSELQKRITALERGSTASDPLTQIVKSTENVLKDIRSDMKPLRFYLLTGKMPFEVKPTPKTVDPDAREGIFRRVNPKFVAEE